MRLHKVWVFRNGIVEQVYGNFVFPLSKGFGSILRCLDGFGIGGGIRLSVKDV